jgi:CxxC motif-containing protein
VINLKSLTSYFMKKYPSFMAAAGWSDEDLYQEIYILLREKGMDLNTDKSLVMTTLKNSLIDKSRKYVRRWQTPCSNCPIGASIKRGNICTRFSTKDQCPTYSEFSRREMSRPNIANCTLFSVSEGIENAQNDVRVSRDIDQIDTADSYQKIWELCMEHLAGEERAVFLEWEAHKLERDPPKRLIEIVRALLKRVRPNSDLTDPKMTV